MIRGGKLLTAEQTARLAMASAADRQRLLRVIAAEMRKQEAEAAKLKKRTRRRRHVDLSIPDLIAFPLLKTVRVRRGPRGLGRQREDALQAGIQAADRSNKLSTAGRETRP